MKVIVQIPCYNEEATLPQTLRDIPRSIPGVDAVEVLVVDDGSTDRTIETAWAHGADHVIRHKANRGLARTFRTGLDAALSLGADVIVNTDGDNQYRGEDIPRLVEPILRGEADIVVGDRQTARIAHFSRHKKLLQALGSFAVRLLSGTDIPDAVSGFRAFSRNAAFQLNIVSSFSYTIETLIQAGKKHMAVASVPVSTNPKTRESRLFKSIPKFLERSLTTMVRMYAMYQPLRVFFSIGAVVTLIGAVPILRFLYFFAVGQGDGHLQSLIIGGALLVIGMLIFVIGIVGDLLNFNRQLLEMVLERTRRMELKDPGSTIANAEWVARPPGAGAGGKKRAARRTPAKGRGKARSSS